MIWAPRSALYAAASAIICASVPAICTAIGPGSPSWLARRAVLSERNRSGRDVTISLTAWPAPSRRHSWRNGRSVTPAIGATMYGLASAYCPICMGSGCWKTASRKRGKRICAGWRAPILTA